jgi:hypothetical protein
LLSLVLTAPLAATDTTQPAAPTAAIQTPDLLSAPSTTAQLPLTRLNRQGAADLAGDGNDICFKIRAYIFKRDDDHAPELAGTTTCGPSQPRAKDVAWPKARLVPAD